MIPSELLNRILHIQYGNGTGTGFVIDRDDKQYLITARHVVEGITTGESINISRDRQWKSFPVKVVGIGLGTTNVAVLVTPTQLAPAHSIEASSDGLAYAQSVYFLGFPFGWDGGAEGINEDYPLPFIKAGKVSAIKHTDATRIYIDAFGSTGFSGGPVAFARNGTPPNELRIAGVVAEAPRPRLRPIVDKSGRPLVDEDGEPIAHFPENQGFVVAFGVNHVTELIDKNPIGFELSSSHERR